MPMMGDAGFGPHPLAFGTIALHESGLPNTMESGEESCFQISLGTHFEVPPGSTSSGFPGDSFFDVFVEVTVGLPQAGASSELDTNVVPILNLTLFAAPQNPKLPLSFQKSQLPLQRRELYLQLQSLQ